MVFHESCAEFRAPGRVLVIDDDPGTLDGFRSVLEASGFTVVTTLSGAEGVCQAARQHFDVVLADLRLPDCSGLDILPDMKAAGITAPILIITGYATVASAVKAIQLGAFDVTEKPLIGDELLAIVNKAITSGRRREPALFSTADDGLQPIAHAAARWARAVVQHI